MAFPSVGGFNPASGFNLPPQGPPLFPQPSSPLPQGFGADLGNPLGASGASPNFPSAQPFGNPLGGGLGNSQPPITGLPFPGQQPGGFPGVGGGQPGGFPFQAPQQQPPISFGPPGGFGPGGPNFNAYA